MPINTFVNYIGQTIGTLQIVGMGLRVDNSPTWIAQCTRCKTYGQKLHHKELVNGTASCVSSICGKPVSLTTSTVASIESITKTSSVRERASRIAFENELRPIERRFESTEELLAHLKKWNHS